jgi:hypothetical protein
MKMTDVYVKLKTGRLFKCAAIDPVMNDLIGLHMIQEFDFEKQKYITLSPESVLVFPTHMVVEIEIKLDKPPVVPLNEKAEPAVIG